MFLLLTCPEKSALAEKSFTFSRVNQNEKLAKVLEAIRQRQKKDNPFRIKIQWVSGEFKPYSGYIVFTQPQALTQWDTEVSFPLLAWNRNSSRGKKLDTALIASIEFASSTLRKKHKCEQLYNKQRSYFHTFCSDLVEETVY